MNAAVAIAATEEPGLLGVCHLKRLWSSVLAAQQEVVTLREDEWHLDRLVIDALGVGLHQTLQYLYANTPAFSEFEEWIIATAGRPDGDYIDRLNADITGNTRPDSVCRWLDQVAGRDPVFTPDDLKFWDEHGYVVLHGAVDTESCMLAEQAIWRHVDADPDIPETWYRQTVAHGIMVEFIQHPALRANRGAARIHKAFAQLWGTTDLWVSSDRCGFHPPQRTGCPFPGPDLHWDIDFDKPLVFGTQGILYLTDTPPEQGALTVVPGFHRRIVDWLQGLEVGADPQTQDLHALGPVPIGGQAGDLIIWQQALPHGSRPNLGVRPRIVQYINMYPGRDFDRITASLSGSRV